MTKIPDPRIVRPSMPVKPLQSRPHPTPLTVDEGTNFGAFQVLMACLNAEFHLYPYADGKYNVVATSRGERGVGYGPTLGAAVGDAVNKLRVRLALELAMDES